MDKNVMIISIVIAFIIIFLVLFVFNVSKLSRIKKGKKKRNNKEVFLIEAQYLFFKYKIRKERLYTLGYAALFAFINSFIISATFWAIELIPWHFAFRMLIGFVMLMGFIYSIYGIMGNILVKRGYQDEHK